MPGPSPTFLPSHRWRSIALTVVTLGLFAFAIRELALEMRGHDAWEVFALIRAMPVETLSFAVGATACGYATLAAFDWMGVRFFRKPVRGRRALLGGFAAFAFVNTTGHALVVGTIVRMRMYARNGLGAADVAELVGFGIVTYWAGMLPLAGLALLFEAPAIARLADIPAWWVHAIGVGCFGVLALHLARAAFGPPEVHVFGRRIALPPLGIIARQLALAMMDIAFASLALYALLPAEARGHLSPFAFVGVYSIVQLVGLASQVPGGLGVIEALIVKLFAPEVDPPTILASMLAFRAIYFLLPFAMGGVIVSHESLRALRPIASRKSSVETRTPSQR